jgi:hypothetical protein
MPLAGVLRIFAENCALLRVGSGNRSQSLPQCSRRCRERRDFKKLIPSTTSNGYSYQCLAYFAKIRSLLRVDQEIAHKRRSQAMMSIKTENTRETSE